MKQKIYRDQVKLKRGHGTFNKGDEGEVTKVQWKQGVGDQVTVKFMREKRVRGTITVHENDLEIVKEAESNA